MMATAAMLMIGHWTYFVNKTSSRSYSSQLILYMKNPNDNGPNMKLNNLYSNARMNWMRHHGTLKFTPVYMNSVLVATWEAFKLTSATITLNAFKKIHTPPSTHHTLTPTTMLVSLVLKLNREEGDEIGQILKASIAPIEMEEFRTTKPMVILREKGRCRSSSNLLIRAAAYDTVRTRTVLPIHQIKTVER